MDKGFVRSKKDGDKNNWSVYEVKTVHKLKWAILKLEFVSDVTPDVENLIFELMEKELTEKLK